MKTLEINKKAIDLAQFKLRSAVEADASEFVRGEFQVVSNGELAMTYMMPEWDWATLKAALDIIQIRPAPRTNGMMSSSRVFGYQPRNSLRRDYCGKTGLMTENAQAHNVLEDYGSKIAELYATLNPALFRRHADMTNEKVLADYALRGSPFTSGIVNRNNPLKYHYDSGNYKDVYSAMIVLKYGIAGGHLSVPELGIRAEMPHGGVLFFDGQKLLHGVTPITKLTADAVRYTVVYYSMQGMWKCEPVGDEVARFRRLRTARQNKRAIGI